MGKEKNLQKASELREGRISNILSNTGIWVIMFFVVTLIGINWLGKLLLPVAVIHKPTHVLKSESSGYTGVTIRMRPITWMDFRVSQVKCILDKGLNSSLLYVGFGPYEFDPTTHKFETCRHWQNGKSRHFRGPVLETPSFKWPVVQGRFLPDILQRRRLPHDRHELYLLIDGPIYEPEREKNMLRLERSDIGDPNSFLPVCTLPWTEMSLIENISFGALTTLLFILSCFISYKRGLAKADTVFGT